MNWIIGQLKANRYPNANKVARQFGINAKTAQRTFDYMRDQAYMPIEYSAQHRGYFCTDHTIAMSVIEMTEGELVAMLLVERLAHQYRGSAIGRQVERAVAKIMNALTEEVSFDLDALMEAHSFEAATSNELSPELFNNLRRAAVDRFRIEMTYYTASRGEFARRRVDPLHLRNYLGEWYLIAFDHKRGEVRDFHAGRISELKVTDEKFDMPLGFDPKSYFSSGFGMIRGQKPIEVEMIFDEYQARWIRERARIHPTEQREELPDGSLKIRMTVGALDGVKRFIFQYGGHVKVVSPVELRKEIQDEIGRMQAIYADG